MLKEPVLRIPWSGRAVEQALRRLKEGDDVVIELPLAIHHALSVRLRPHQPHLESEPIDQTGDRRLLEAVADIAGLEELRRLLPHLPSQCWRVTVASPHPRVILRRRG